MSQMLDIFLSVAIFYKHSQNSTKCFSALFTVPFKKTIAFEKKICYNYYGCLYDDVMKGYIYKIINVENGHFYVGSTIEIEKRKKRHFKDLKDGRHHSMYLQRAYDKYGENSFRFIIIKERVFKEVVAIW